MTYSATKWTISRSLSRRPLTTEGCCQICFKWVIVCSRMKTGLHSQNKSHNLNKSCFHWKVQQHNLLRFSYPETEINGQYCNLTSDTLRLWKQQNRENPDIVFHHKCYAIKLEAPINVFIGGKKTERCLFCCKMLKADGRFVVPTSLLQVCSWSHTFKLLVVHRMVGEWT